MTPPRYTLTVRACGRTLVALAGLAPAEAVDVRRAARWAFGDGSTIALTSGDARVEERRRGGRWWRVR